MTDDDETTTETSAVEEIPTPFLRFMYSEPGGWIVRARIGGGDDAFEVDPCVTGAVSENEARAYASLVLPKVYPEGTSIEILGVELVDG